MFQTPQHSSSIKGVFLNSFSLYKDIFFKVLLWAVLIAICKILINTNIDYTTVDQQPVPELSAVSAIFVLITMLINSIVMLQIWSVVKNKAMSFLEVFRIGIRRAFIIMVFYTIFVVGVAFVVFLSIVLVSLLLHAIPAVGKVLMILYIIAIGLVCTYIVISIFSWVPMVMDGEKVWHAFKRSFQIIKGNWWQTFGLLMMSCAIMVLCSAILGLITVGSSVQQLEGLSHMSSIGDYIYTFVSVIVFMPWLLSILVLQTHNLRLKAAGK